MLVTSTICVCTLCVRYDPKWIILGRTSNNEEGSFVGSIFVFVFFWMREKPKKKEDRIRYKECIL